MQRNTSTRPPRKVGKSDSRRRISGSSGMSARREGSSRREAAGPASPRRRTRRDVHTIIIDSDSDVSIEEIESPALRSDTATRQPSAEDGLARQNDVVAALLWPLRTTLSITISIFQALVSPIILQMFLPILGFLLAIAAIAIVARFGLPFLLRSTFAAVQIPLKIAWNLLRGDLHFSDFNIGQALSNINNNLPSGTAVRNGLCFVAPIPGLCTTGILERMKAVQEQDRAIVARKLQKEGQDALDIFDSVFKLGTGGAEGGLHHTKIWELSTAIKVSSNLAEKFEIAYDMRQLGDMSRDLSDEISVLAAESNSVFAWTVREFDRLFHTLADEDSSLTPKELEERLHRVMVRIQGNLDNLYRITERTIPKAEAGSALGGRIIESVSWEVERLEKGIKAEPGWKHLREQAQRFILGENEPSKLDILHNDLALSKLTVHNLQEIRLSLEIVRKHLRNHRTEVGLFSSGLMGFHLGFPSREENEPGAAANIELKLLGEIVAEMKGALLATKQHRHGQALLALD